MSATAWLCAAETGTRCQIKPRQPGALTFPKQNGGPSCSLTLRAVENVVEKSATQRGRSPVSDTGHGRHSAQDTSGDATLKQTNF